MEKQSCKWPVRWLPSTQLVNRRVALEKITGAEIKKELSKLGQMRPGKLSRQSRKDRNGKEYGSYWKLGYTYKMKVKSEYIPDQLVETIQRQNQTFRTFKALTEEWIDLALQIGQFETEAAKQKEKKEG